MKITEAILQKVDSIPSMPATVLRLGDLLADTKTEIEDVVKAVRHDPGFTANVLRLANSAFLGFSRPAGSVKEALIRVGMQRAYQMVMAKSVKPMASRSLDGYDLASGDFWRHSIAVATAAEIIQRQSSTREGDAFTAGLLHDIGKLILSDFIGQNAEDFRAKADADTAFDKMEKSVLGIDHAELGAAVLEKWNMVGEVVSVVRFHHHPDSAREAQELVDHVHIADCLCLSTGLGTGRDGLQYMVSQSAVGRVGLATEQMEQTVIQTMDRMEEFQGMLAAV